MNNEREMFNAGTSIDVGKLFCIYDSFERIYCRGKRYIDNKSIFERSLFANPLYPNVTRIVVQTFALVAGMISGIGNKRKSNKFCTAFANYFVKILMIPTAM